jgi:hypothetical protein
VTLPHAIRLLLPANGTKNRFLKSKLLFSAAYEDIAPLPTQSCIVLAQPPHGAWSDIDARANALVIGATPSISLPCRTVSVSIPTLRPPIENTRMETLPASDTFSSASFVPMHRHNPYHDACCTSSRHATFTSAAIPSRCTLRVSNHRGDAGSQH